MGSEQRAHGSCSTWLSQWGLWRGKDLQGRAEKPCSHLQLVIGGGGDGGREDTQLLGERLVAGTRRIVPASPRVLPVHVARHRTDRRAADEDAAGNKLKNGSALVIKSQRRELLATIIISIISVNYSIIRDY